MPGNAPGWTRTGGPPMPRAQAAAISAIRMAGAIRRFGMLGACTMTSGRVMFVGNRDASGGFLWLARGSRRCYQRANLAKSQASATINRCDEGSPRQKQFVLGTVLHHDFRRISQVQQLPRPLVQRRPCPNARRSARRPSAPQPSRSAFAAARFASAWANCVLALLPP